MADYPHVQDPFDVSEYGRAKCDICGGGMYRDESRSSDVMLCSDYCHGRHDERTGGPLR